MKLDAMTRARARLAAREACRDYLYDGNVTSIDVGFPEREGSFEPRPAIRFHVAKKLRGFALESAFAAGATAPLPAQVGGFETDVLEGRYRPHWWFPWGWRPTTASRRLGRSDPLRGGISLSREGGYGAGTLGGIVTDRASGGPMILSNWHVLVADWATRPGVAAYQPGRRDGGSSEDRVGAYARDAMASNLDAAVATLDGKRGHSSEQLDLGRVAGAGEPDLGVRVVKSGRTTAITHGVVTGIDGTAKIRYGPIDRLIRRVVTIDPVPGSSVVSDGGDSGSLWLDAATRACVALHFAGSNLPERALGMDIAPVLEALGVDLA